jgi:hypothetical protein
MDLCYGSKGASTPLRYNTDYSHFIYLPKDSVSPKGKLTIKMTPYKSRKYLHPIKDYYYYEFYSPINPWDSLSQSQPQYLTDMEKIQWIDIDLYPGNMLFIPPYWWYSIQYAEEETFFYSFKYNTIMNVISNAHNLGYYTIQQYTTQVKPAKVLHIEPVEPIEPKEKKEDVFVN